MRASGARAQEAYEPQLPLYAPKPPLQRAADAGRLLGKGRWVGLPRVQVDRGRATVTSRPLRYEAGRLQWGSDGGIRDKNKADRGVRRGTPLSARLRYSSPLRSETASSSLGSSAGVRGARGCELRQR